MKHRSHMEKRKYLKRVHCKLKRNRSSSSLCNIRRNKQSLRRDKRSRSRYSHLKVIGFRNCKKKHRHQGNLGHVDHLRSDSCRGSEVHYDEHENLQKHNIRGPQGLQGLQGPQGNPGVPGMPGIPGAQGAQGIPGLPGEQGAQGVPGEQGLQGMPGAQGPTGATGAQGIQGIPGIQGTQGIPGISGQQGVQGQIGATGVTGVTGPPGEQGVRGVTGVTGPQGPGITGGVEVIVLPTVYRYFYFPADDLQSTVTIPSHQFTDDNGNAITVIDGIGSNSYTNIFINGILQEGSLYTITTTGLTLYLGGSIVYASVPITVENVEFNTQVIYI